MSEAFWGSTSVLGNQIDLDLHEAVTHPELAADALIYAWVDECTCLFANGVDEVLATLAGLKKLSVSADEWRRALVGYYSRNRHRMQYGSFRDRGLQIGWGLMEVAHRPVVQCWMKRSGQRWSVAGAQAMLNLRVASTSRRWALVTDQLGRV